MALRNESVGLWSEASCAPSPGLNKIAVRYYNGWPPTSAAAAVDQTGFSISPVWQSLTGLSDSDAVARLLSVRSDGSVFIGR